MKAPGPEQAPGRQNDSLQYSVSVNMLWRIFFRRESKAPAVEVVDYFKKENCLPPAWWDVEDKLDGADGAERFQSGQGLGLWPDG